MYSGTTTTKTCSHEPKAVFKHNDITFYGATSRNIEGKHLQSGDLILNCGAYNSICSGSISTGPFKKTPTWLDPTPYKLSFYVPDEIWLDWDDFKTPVINVQFWKDLIQKAKENGIKRVIVTCSGGHGRTGTALSALLVAIGVDARKAVLFLRQHYCTEAVETTDQYAYIKNLDKILNNHSEEEQTKINI
ncbi:MAG: protein-tyrosine phosphatase family protein [Nanoarchaeota archaeon]